MPDRILAIIPARYASTRLPGKPLLDLAGKPMIQHVYERTCQANVQDVLVATDDSRIYQTVLAFGGQAVMTSPSHLSGTDRVAEAARALACDVVVNVQGDEPLLHPDMINQLLAPLQADPTLPMSTLAHRLDAPEEARNPNVVKVVWDQTGCALYFSRSPIPYLPSSDALTFPMWRHIGLYGYRADFLQIFARMTPGILERIEKLEQLRVLEYARSTLDPTHYRIRVVETEHRAMGVDTPEDLQHVRQLLG